MTQGRSHQRTSMVVINPHRHSGGLPTPSLAVMAGTVTVAVTGLPFPNFELGKPAPTDLAT